jgi:hypothetical protein
MPFILYLWSWVQQYCMKFLTRSLRSLANKLHILARQADIFGINQFTSR